MPLIQWIMQNLQPRAQDSALLGGSASINLEYQFPTIGEEGGAILGAETADFVVKQLFRRKIRFIPGDIAFDICSHQKWTILAYYFDLNGRVKYLAYNNIQQVEFYEEELEIERFTVRENYLTAKNKIAYLEALSGLQDLNRSFAPLSSETYFVKTKFISGESVYDVYKRQKWQIISSHIDLNGNTTYVAENNKNKKQFVEQELEKEKFKAKENYEKTKEKVEYLEALSNLENTKNSFISLTSETQQVVFKFNVGEIVYDTYKKQKWKILGSSSDLNGDTVYFVSSNNKKKQFLEEELQSEKIIMKELYEEAKSKIDLLQASSMVKLEKNNRNKGIKK